jgi:hypothetical protein
LGASLATRFRTREVWFWRWQETGNGVYLAPHFNLPWQVVALLFLIVLQGDVWCLYKLSNGHRIKGTSLLLSSAIPILSLDCA